MITQSASQVRQSAAWSSVSEHQELCPELCINIIYQLVLSHTEIQYLAQIGDLKNFIGGGKSGYQSL